MGHERVEVLEDRRQFVDYFLNNYDLFDFLIKKIGENKANPIYEWNLAKKQRRILTAHYKPTFN